MGNKSIAYIQTKKEIQNHEERETEAKRQRSEWKVRKRRTMYRKIHLRVQSKIISNALRYESSGFRISTNSNWKKLNKIRTTPRLQ